MTKRFIFCLREFDLHILYIYALNFAKFWSEKNMFYLAYFSIMFGHVKAQSELPLKELNILFSQGLVFLFSQIPFQDETIISIYVNATMLWIFLCYF